MFDKLKAMAGMASMLKDLPAIKGKMNQVKEELGRVQCTGHSQCRRVRAVMNGQLQLVTVDIDPAFATAAAADAKRRRELQEALVEAVNDAGVHARREAGTRMAGAAQELGLPIPPGVIEQLQ